MKTPRFEFKAAARLGLLLGGYGAALAGAFYLAYDIRFDFQIPIEVQMDRNHFALALIPLQILLLGLFGQFRGLLTYFSIPDLLRIVAAIASSDLFFTVLWYGSGGAIAPPRGVLISDFVLSVSSLCVFRLGLRVYRERFAGAHDTSEKMRALRRIVIIGAGDVGAQLLHEATSRHLGLRPVCFLDDDATKHGRHIYGLAVRGSPELLPSVVEQDHIEAAVLAMPSASRQRVAEIVRVASEAGIKVEIVPSLSELATGRVRVTKIRPVEVADLLGREAVNLDSAAIGQRIGGQTVMVTGAGGSIGAELCRQLASYNPQRLLMVDQSEGGLFVIEQELQETGGGASLVPLVGSISDAERMNYIMGRFKPAVIFHAAAHKHVYMMERQPAEAIRNNFFGTRQLARIAVEHGVEGFVLISSDKAINPTSVMGATKRLAELHLMGIASDPACRTKFMSVRFGNVLGSSGSVIPIFKRQIENGGPVTVTNPEVTRYFMTIPEAVGLVLQSFVLGRGGEIFVLDMGQPVRIIDLAKQMIELSGLRPGEDIEIKFTGLKPGEKLYEELQHHTESHTPTAHPRIMRFTSDAVLNESLVRELEKEVYHLDVNDLKSLLRRLVPEYNPHLD